MGLFSSQHNPTRVPSNRYHLISRLNSAVGAEESPQLSPLTQRIRPPETEILTEMFLNLFEINIS